MSNDTISRQAAIEQIQAWATNIGNPKMLVKEDAIYVLESLPSIPSERKRGEWLEQGENGHGFWMGKCDQCGKENEVNHFCPNCGADMRGKNNEL